MAQTASVHQPRGRWHRGPEAPLPPGHTEHGEPWQHPPRLQSLSEGLPPSLGGGRALADQLQLALGGTVRFFPLSCTKKGKLILSHYGLENPTGSFDFKLLLKRGQRTATDNCEGLQMCLQKKICSLLLPPWCCAASLQHSMNSTVGSKAPPFARTVPSESLGDW